MLTRRAKAYSISGSVV